MFLFLLLTYCQAEFQRHLLQPWDIQDPEKEAVFSGVFYLISDGEYLLIADVREPEVFVFKTDGTFVQKIKRSGQGPMEFGTNINGLGMGGGVIFIVGSKPTVHLFDVGGEHLDSFPLAAFNVAYWQSPNFLAVDSENQIFVGPAFPRKKALAYVYDFDGRVKKKFGDPLRIDEKTFLENRAATDQLWVRDKKYWYCAFKSQPIIRKFDEKFRFVAEYVLSGPEVRLAQERAAEFIAEGSTPVPLVTCFQAHNNRLFAMVGNGLLELDADTGSHLKTHIFFGEGDVFEDAKGNRLTLPIFDFLDDNTLVLAHQSMLWGHDLWLVSLSKEIQEGTAPYTQTFN